MYLVTEEKLVVSSCCWLYCWLFVVAVGCIGCFEVLKTYVTEEKLVVGCCWSLLVVLKLLVL